MELIHVKTYLVNSVASDTEIRRFDIELTTPLQYDKLEEKIRIAYQETISVKDKIKLHWFDDDNEEIGFSNDSEYQYAVNFWKTLKPDYLMLKVNVRKELSSKKNIRKTQKTIKKFTDKAPPVIVKESDLQPLICNGCDQKLLDEKFKSYVCPQINLCNHCQHQNSEFIEQPKIAASSDETKFKRIPNSISVQQLGELGQKGLDNLASFSKKVNTNINSIYQNNVKVLLPGYKLSELSKKADQPGTSESKTEVEGITEDDIKKVEEVTEVLSLPVSADELDEELEEPIVMPKSLEMEDLESFQIIESDCKVKNLEVEEIIKEIEKSVDEEEMIQDTLEKLKQMGIVEDESNNLRDLIKLKNGKVDAIVDIYFESFNQDKKKELVKEVD